MELFKFIPGSDPTVLEKGQMINKATSIMWTERYLDPGEFEIVAPMSTGLREFLPIGIFVSHVDTYEVMIVENHEINESQVDDPIVKVTGRSLECYLENRIVGVNLARASSSVSEYILTASNTWNQAVKMINDHIKSPPANANDIFGNVSATTTISGTGTSEERVIDRIDLHRATMDVLAIDDVGIRSRRRNSFAGGNPNETTLSIYKGADRSASVRFAWKSGDLESVDYLFSDRKLKNSALVQGRYVNTVVDTGPTKYQRRFMLVDADDIDGHLSAPPTGGALTTIINKMATRGRQALKAQKLITISRADISEVTNHQFRKDYDVGDLITLDGDFGQVAVMRVIEYVEIEDENGESGHPTLSVPEAGAGFSAFM